MRLGELLAAAGVISEEQVAAALDWQLNNGGRLGAALVATGAIEQASLQAFLDGIPPEPRTLTELGLPESFILDLLLKHLAAGVHADIAGLSGALRLAPQLVADLADRAVQAQLAAVLGGTGLSARLELTQAGKARAAEAMARSGWCGPAPIAFDAWVHWLDRQKVSNEVLDRAAFARAFHDLEIADVLIGQLGPAVMSGRAVLMHGPPGNGKTSVAQRLERVFRQIVHVPHAVFIDGVVLSVFDPDLHRPLDPDALALPLASLALHRDEADGRFVPCRRPFVVAGGELTLDMLDVRHEAGTGIGVAPLHIKAAGGCLLIDDFGRQQVSPAALLNRWIIPLENRVDYLKLANGKSVRVPFEAVVIFSTNLAPADLMDPAFLRRIPYKIEVGAPAPERWARIFRSVAASLGLEADIERAVWFIEALTGRMGVPLAAFQPRFILDQVVAGCAFRGQPPGFDEEVVALALANLTIGQPPEAAAITTLARVA